MTIFVKVFHRIIPYDNGVEAKKGNPAAGIKMGANILALKAFIEQSFHKK